MRPFFLALLAAAASIAAASPARAQEDERPATLPATPVSRDADGMWRNDYALARERLLAGDFADAAERFDALAGTASTPSDRALAVAMRDVARSWASRGLALVRRNDLGESNLPARSVDERTTDEIAQLYAAGVFYGVGTGIWLDTHTQAGNAAGVVLPMIGFAAAADATVALLDINHPLHYGVAQSTVSGLYLGFEEGLVLSLWNETQQDAGKRWQANTAADVMWAFSTVGAVGGGLLGNSLGATPGRAAFVGSAGLWSAALTGLAAAAFTGDDASRAPNAFLAAGIGLNAGALAGLLGASAVSPSIARVRFLDLGAVGGGLVAGGLYLAAADKNGNSQAFSGATALGIGAGLAIAWTATRGIPADRPEERQAPPAVSLTPTLAPVAGGATLGVGGIL